MIFKRKSKSNNKQINPGVLDFEYLDRLADLSGAEYKSAHPYPHTLFEKIVDPLYLDEVLNAFPSPGENIGWRKVSAKLENTTMQHNKLGMPHERELAPVIRSLLWEMNSGRFLQFLEKLTGIQGLIPDPLMQGGGLHQILPGGVLGVHADFTRHRVYDLDRRVNVLLYLNKDWRKEYGGHLELWSRDVSHCARRLAPQFGRCVIFNTDSDSYHGHPQPVACPDGETRKSIALYYYTNGRSDGVVSPTNATDWQSLPDVGLPPLE